MDTFYMQGENTFKTYLVQHIYKLIYLQQCSFKWTSSFIQTFIHSDFINTSSCSSHTFSQLTHILCFQEQFIHVLTVKPFLSWKHFFSVILFWRSEWCSHSFIHVCSYICLSVHSSPIHTKSYTNIMISESSSKIQKYCISATLTHHVCVIKPQFVVFFSCCHIVVIIICCIMYIGV